MEHSTQTDLMKDHVILITGAGGAIGGAAARAFAAQGASVILLGRSLLPLEKTYDAIVAAGHAQPAICPLDFASATADDFVTIAATIQQQFGRLDGLLHAAATLGSLTPIEHYDLPLWQRVLQVNLTSPMQLTRACLPLLKASEAGAILFSTSAVGLRGQAYWGAYGVAQAGIENLAETLADELEENTAIRVNSIDPGPIRSRLRALAYPGEDPNTLPGPETVIPVYLQLMRAAGEKTSGQRIQAINHPHYLA
ncbi:MAG: YciK family oxidoreductase [Gammaproteobacteria bacterium]|nr:YciK family oxidoreductase [Gammaproteobacteria bacterium]